MIGQGLIETDKPLKSQKLIKKDKIVQDKLIDRGWTDHDIGLQRKCKKDGGPDFEKMNEMLMLTIKMELDFKNKVNSFLEVNMLDPFAPDVKPVMTQVKNYSFMTQVYPDSVVGELLEATKHKLNIKPPRCVFVPHDDLVRTMIEAVALYGHTKNYESFFLRFGLLDDPNWYL